MVVKLTTGFATCHHHLPSPLLPSSKFIIVTGHCRSLCLFYLRVHHRVLRLRSSSRLCSCLSSYPFLLCWTSSLCSCSRLVRVCARVRVWHCVSWLVVGSWFVDLCLFLVVTVTVIVWRNQINRPSSAWSISCQYRCLGTFSVCPSVIGLY
jgi:hypothetical protein